MNVASRPSPTGKTRTCPHCKAVILESLSICPGCMHHLRFDSEAAKRQVAATSALKVEAIIRHPPVEEAVGVLRHHLDPQRSRRGGRPPGGQCRALCRARKSAPSRSRWRFCRPARRRGARSTACQSRYPIQGVPGTTTPATAAGGAPKSPNAPPPNARRPHRRAAAASACRTAPSSRRPVSDPSASSNCPGWMPRSSASTKTPAPSAPGTARA